MILLFLSIWFLLEIFTVVLKMFLLDQVGPSINLP